MKDFKQIIAEEIEKATNINKEKILENIGVPKDTSNGDYAFPCFILAKELKKSPVAIAKEIKEKISQNLENIKEISEVSAVNGFLNFKLNKNQITQEVIDEFDNEKENFGGQKQEKPQNIVIDYSAPNIAKPFHIGHLRSTVIGQALYNIYKYLGYNVTSINHLGDYGTQFGKLIEGYKRWGAEYDIENNPIDELMQIYVRINNLCKEDESVLEECRNNFKKLEDGDPYCVEIWKKFRELSLKEFDKVYDILNRQAIVNKDGSIGILSGFLKCKCCGGNMIKRTSKERVYYYCSNYYRNKTCENNESISENKLIEIINEKLNLSNITRLELENKVKCIYIDKNKNVKIDIK